MSEEPLVVKKDATPDPYPSGGMGSGTPNRMGQVSEPRSQGTAVVAEEHGKLVDEYQKSSAEFERSKQEAINRGALEALRPKSPGPKRSSPPANAPSGLPPTDESEAVRVLSDVVETRRSLRAAAAALPQDAASNEKNQSVIEGTELLLDVASQLAAHKDRDSAEELIDRAKGIVEELGHMWGMTATGQFVVAVYNDLHIALTGKDPTTGEEVSNLHRVFSAATWLGPAGKALGFAKLAAALTPLVASRRARAAATAQSLLRAIESASVEVADLTKCKDCGLGVSLDEAVKHGADILAKLRSGWAGVGEPATATHDKARKLFFAHFPATKGKVWVHHAIEWNVLEKWPGLFEPGELNSIASLRGIPNGINKDIHLSRIRIFWNRFYQRFKDTRPTREQVIEFVKQIDDELGRLFDPPVR